MKKIIQLGLIMGICFVVFSAFSDDNKSIVCPHCKKSFSVNDKPDDKPSDDISFGPGVNKVDGFPMQGQRIGKKLGVLVGGELLPVASFDLTVRSTHNLSWVQGSIDFPSRSRGNAGFVFQEFSTSMDNFNSDSSWDDSKVKKVTLHFRSFSNDGKPVLDVTLVDCIINFHNGICEYKALKGKGSFKTSQILAFDGTNDSRETLVGSSFSVTAEHNL